LFLSSRVQFFFSSRIPQVVETPKLAMAYHTSEYRREEDRDEKNNTTGGWKSWFGLDNKNEDRDYSYSKTTSYRNPTPSYGYPVRGYGYNSDEVTRGPTYTGRDYNTPRSTGYGKDDVYYKEETRTIGGENKNSWTPINRPTGDYTTNYPITRPTEYPGTLFTERPTGYYPGGHSAAGRVGTEFPTGRPTEYPTTYPTTTTGRWSEYPTGRPTEYPTYGRPTEYPTYRPTEYPTYGRSTEYPTYGRWSEYPTGRPTEYPTTGRWSEYPTGRPTEYPTYGRPTEYPTYRPTEYPTYGRPTEYPTYGRWSEYPTGRPTEYPTTGRWSEYPTGRPTEYPITRPYTAPRF